MSREMCDYCHKRFGKHSDDQFDLCFERRLKERRRLIKEARIPESNAVRYFGPTSLMFGTVPRLKKEMAEWPCLTCGLNKPMGEHSDDEFLKCFVEFATQGEKQEKKP